MHDRLEPQHAFAFGVGALPVNRPKCSLNTVSNVAAHLRNGVSDKVLPRTSQYWKNIDEVRDNIEQAVRDGLS